MANLLSETDRPSALLVLVLQRLSPCAFSIFKCASVAQTWRVACLDSLLWKRITLTLSHWDHFHKIFGLARGNLVQLLLGCPLPLPVHSTALQQPQLKFAGSRLESITLHCKLRIQTVAAALSYWGCSRVKKIHLSFPHIAVGEMEAREAVHKLELCLDPSARKSKLRGYGMNLFWCTSCDLMLAHKYWCKCCDVVHRKRNEDWFACLGCGSSAERAFFACKNCTGMACEHAACTSICAGCGAVFCAACCELDNIWDLGLDECRECIVQKSHMFRLTDAMPW